MDHVGNARVSSARISKLARKLERKEWPATWANWREQGKRTRPGARGPRVREMAKADDLARQEGKQEQRDDAGKKKQQAWAAGARHVGQGRLVGLGKLHVFRKKKQKMLRLVPCRKRKEADRVSWGRNGPRASRPGDVAGSRGRKETAGLGHAGKESCWAAWREVGSPVCWAVWPAAVASSWPDFKPKNRP